MSKLTYNRIELSNQRTEDIQNQLRGFAVEMKSNLQSVMDYTLLGLKKLYLAMDMNKHLQNFLQDLEQLANGKLEPSQVPPAQMKETMRKIGIILKTNFPKFKLIMTNPHYYYSKAKIAAARMNESLVIKIQFSLTSWGKSFDIYKVLTTKVPIPTKKHCS